MRDIPFISFILSQKYHWSFQLHRQFRDTLSFLLSYARFLLALYYSPEKLYIFLDINILPVYDGRNVAAIIFYYILLREHPTQFSVTIKRLRGFARKIPPQVADANLDSRKFIAACGKRRSSIILDAG